MRHSPRPFAAARHLLAPLALCAALPAAAQQVDTPPPTLHERSTAAGYKALILCSAIFNGGRTQAQVEALELTGIYPEYDSLLPTLKAIVDHAKTSVTVAYDKTMPPRLAHRPGAKTGCVIHPPGTVSPTATSTISPGLWRAGDATLANPRPWPDGDARLPKRADRRVAPLLAAAFTPQYGARARTVSVVITQNGKFLGERYAEGFTPFTANRSWSVAKSIAGTLAGVAARTHLIAPAQPANIPEWQSVPSDPRRAITFDQLLRMASGLHTDTAGNRSDAVYFGGMAVTQETVSWPLETAPGSRFRYANNDILLAMRAMRATLGEDRYRDFPQAELFAPLGMRHTIAERDVAGNYVISSQLWSTARDFARLGQFWLQDGVWNGQRMLPSGWMRYMTTPSGTQPERGPGYGATMWLFGPEQGLPAGSYAAQGNRGQYIMVIPAHALVIVRRGEDPGGGFDIAAYARDVIKALSDARR